MMRSNKLNGRFAGSFIVSIGLLALPVLAHDCPNQIVLDQWGPVCGDMHAQDAQLLGRIPNWVSVQSSSSSSSLDVVGRDTYENHLDSQNFTGHIDVSCAVTEQWSVTAGISTGLTLAVKGVILPAGAEWETTVHLSGEYSNSETKEWTVSADLNVPPCARHTVTVRETNTRVSTTAIEGTWEFWWWSCPGYDEGSNITLVCAPQTAEGGSSRFSDRVTSLAEADPATVPGCYPPGVDGGGDTDGDGIPNIDDPDVDGDGEPNGTDPDIDGDGDPNTTDTDMDGDGQPNSNDSNIDGDGKPNTGDNDIDGDGVPNDQDSDMDGDGEPNETDDDMDGDGEPNETDDDPDGPSFTGILIVLLNLILYILFPVLS